MSNVSLLAQASGGYLWMAAPREGLVRFDGIRFKSMADPRTSPGAYPGDREITALLATKDDTLWVGTPHGLWRLRDGQWSEWQSPGQLPERGITALCESRDGGLWAATATGVIRIDDRVPRAYSAKDLMGARGSVTAILADRNQTVWVGTSTGQLFQLLGDQFTEIPRFHEADFEPVNAIIEARDGAVWVGMWGKRVARFDAGKVRLFGPAVDPWNHELLALAEDRWGAIWLGTNRGLFVVEMNAPDHERLKHVPIEEASTQALLRDQDGIVWVGTEAGLCAFSDWQLKVFSKREGMPNRNISSITQARDGGLWVGTYTNGLVRFRDERIVATYSSADGLSSDDVTSICETRDGTLLVGTWGNGLNRLQGNRFVRFPQDETMVDDIIRSIYEDREGTLWIGTWNNGLRRLKGGVLTTFTKSDGLVSDQVRVLAEDERGNLWIATQEGLSRYRDGEFETFTAEDGLSEDSIFALHADREGSVWIGTRGGGLNRLRDGKFTCYSTVNGLPSDIICEILDDDNGNLWIGSLRGIFRIKKADLDAFDNKAVPSISSVLYDTTDGMRAAQCNRGTQSSAFRSSDGCLWFATIFGMVLIDPNRLPPAALPPRAIVEEVLYNGRPRSDGFDESQTPLGNHEIEVRYTATSFRSAQKVHFSYKLEGYNRDWVDNRSNREAHFTNVPAGSHVFRVKASLGDGTWGPESTPFVLTIEPPFYRTAWFLSACALGTLATVGIAFGTRTARLRERQRELMVLVERRTAEARAAQQAAEEANRAKDRFLAVLSHELRTPLTPVLLSVGSLLEEQLGPETHEQIDMIRRNIELESRLVDDLLDVSRIGRGQLHLELELVDVHEVIGRTLEVCAAETRASGLTILLELNAPAHHVHADYARLIQLFWNLVRNAAKFAGPSGTLVIQTLNVKNPRGDVHPDRLIIEFQDNGIGIDPKMINRIFDPFEQGSDQLRSRGAGLGLGLAISRAVALAHGGELTAQSAGRGQGATFRVELECSPERASATAPGSDPLAIPARPAPRPARLRILLVEDNVDTLRYLAATLGRRGHEITTAPDLATALDAARGHDIDLLISDIELPDGTGLDLMRELAPRAIPGIALSGYGSTDDVRLSQEAGFRTHLVKPVTADVLEQAVAICIGAGSSLIAADSVADNGGGAPSFTTAAPRTDHSTDVAQTQSARER